LFSRTHVPLKGRTQRADLEVMAALGRALGVLIGVLVLAVGGTALADGGSGSRPDVTGTSTSDITASSAVLKATIHPEGHETTYFFEYGQTEAYGSQTAQASAGDDDNAHPVNVPVSGLHASTTYHYRVVATNSGGTTRGPDKTFTTLAAPPGDPGDPGTPSDPGTPAPTEVLPEFGSSVLVAPASGDLLVKRPGASGFVPLELGSELPVGTEIDARAGSIALTAALPSGATQTGHFGGGRFKLGQDKRGYVDLYLRGRYCTRAERRALARSHGSAVASAAATRSKRKLWGRDHGGRFRTHGRNSHATVRGTRWVVADTCKGTFTRVSKGSVVVRDTVRRKRVVLDAGERYLARPPRR
jgi:hypothetical protein